MDTLDAVGARWSKIGRDEESADWVLGVRFTTRRMHPSVLADSLADRRHDQLEQLGADARDEAMAAMVDAYRAARRERVALPEAKTTPAPEAIPETATLGWIRLEYGRAGAFAAIEAAMERHGGNKSAVARALGTDPRTLRRSYAELQRHCR